MKSGTSLVITLPEEYVKENGIKHGDYVETRLDGGTGLLTRAKKGE